MEPTSVRLQRATFTESASTPRKPPDSERPAPNDPTSIRNIAASVFSESRDVMNTRNYRKWRSMRKRDLALFYEEHQQTFLRRMRRGVPQRFRWDAWKEAAQLRKVLQATTLDPVLPLVPYGEERWRSGSSSAEDDEDLFVFNKSRLEELKDTTSPIELFQMLTAHQSKFAALIDIDIARTFPEIAVFDQKAQRSLHTILNAYANFAPNVGYCQGMNFVMGFIMLVSSFAPEVECFWFFATLMSRYHLHGFFREGFPLLDTYITAFDQLAEHYAPELRRHFAKENVLPPVYLHQWYLTLFVTSLPLGTVVVIWDFFMSIGLHALLPVTLALLKVLQSFLLRLRFEGIVKFLKSLRSSGDCDEAKIGKMLVRQAEHYPILEQFRATVIDVDLARLLGSPPRRSVEGSSLVDFESIVSGADLNPLNVALIEHNVEDEEEDESIMPPTEEPRRSLRFLPKVIGHRKV